MPVPPSRVTLLYRKALESQWSIVNDYLASLNNQGHTETIFLKKGMLIQHNGHTCRLTETFLGIHKNGHYESIMADHFNQSLDKQGRLVPQLRAGVKGEGTFGKVKFGKWFNGKSCAIKSFQQKGSVSDTIRLQEAEAEVDKLRKVGQEAYLVVTQNPKNPHGPLNIVVVMEAAMGKSADHFLRWKDGQCYMSQQDVFSYLIQCAEQLHELHTKYGHVHCDFKPANSVWDPVTKKAKVIDLGGATALGVVPEVCTKYYASPEQTGFYRQGAAPGMDMHALGVILRDNLAQKFTVNGNNFPDCMLSGNSKVRVDFPTLIDSLKKEQAKRFQAPPVENHVIVPKKRQTVRFSPPPKIEEPPNIYFFQEFLVKNHVEGNIPKDWYKNATYLKSVCDRFLQAELIKILGTGGTLQELADSRERVKQFMSTLKKITRLDSFSSLKKYSDLSSYGDYFLQIPGLDTRNLEKWNEKSKGEMLQILEAITEASFMKENTDPFFNTLKNIKNWLKIPDMLEASDEAELKLMYAELQYLTSTHQNMPMLQSDCLKISLDCMKQEITARLNALKLSESSKIESTESYPVHVMEESTKKIELMVPDSSPPSSSEEVLTLSEAPAMPEPEQSWWGLAADLFYKHCLTPAIEAAAEATGYVAEQAAIALCDGVEWLGDKLDEWMSDQSDVPMQQDRGRKSKIEG